MRILIETLLKHYHYFYNNDSKPSDQKVGNIIKNEIPEKMMTLLNLDNRKFKVEGSYGIGNKTKTPWISIFDKEITEGARKGFYVVFLFREDMSGFYLSLNQGTTYLAKKFKGNKPREKMIDVAQNLRQELDFYSNEFTESFIDLRSKTDNAKNYEAANIYSKFYDVNNVPDNNELVSDILTLLEGLYEIKKFIGTREFDIVIDDLIYKGEVEDTKYQQEILISKPSKTNEVPQTVGKKTSKSKSGGWTRDPSKAKEALIKSNYSCEIESSHLTFISSITNENFLEAHHLVPMNAQGEFNVGLDVPGNIVSLCPNCHRKIHHATSKEKRDILIDMFNKRKTNLRNFGIDIEIDKLIKLYGIS
ncbi:MrcB family domain-containing protein [Salipaludibacillus sp. CF4.18]|uniref:MrcB family domain-containing protein n=1 Tax=Salipaludibacillus sp. CF4.18 TaxID=3373081 RepID=UPI003EE5A124